MTEQEPDELAAAVDERLAERLDAARRRREQQQAERKQRAVRRKVGLRARHAAKLRRVQEQRKDTP